MEKRFQELDALRGIAALAVVVFHFTGYVVKWGHFGDFPFYFTLGERGVQLFFMVSGFVIYFTLEKSRTLADFVFSRFTRLYPTYWASLALWAAFTVAVLGDKLWITGFAVNATMLQKFIGVQDLDVVYWTLAIELVFYAWMAALFAAGMLKRITTFAAVWLLASVAWAVTRKFVAVPEALNTYFILQHIPYFIAGIMFRRIQTQGISPIPIALIVLALIDSYLIKGMPDLTAATVFFLVFGLAVTGRLKFLNNSVLLWLGAISYPLYVTHRNMGYEMLQILHDHGMASTLSVPLMIAAALGVASAVTYWFEKPVMGMLRDWYRNRASAQAQLRGTSGTVRPALPPS